MDGVETLYNVFFRAKPWFCFSTFYEILKIELTDVRPTDLSVHLGEILLSSSTDFSPSSTELPPFFHIFPVFPLSALYILADFY